MDNSIKKELSYDLDRTIKILELREEKDAEEFKILSDHVIEDLASHKNLDVVSIAVLIYSIYKVVNQLNVQDYTELIKQLKQARDYLQKGNLGNYNRILKNVYSLIRKTNTKVNEHLQDVMLAARIKKGTNLVLRGLSIGQAAGLMGLSNWDLQQYVGRTPILDERYESLPAKERMITALKIFLV